MARHGVHRMRSTGVLVVDCQSDLLDDLATGFVVPLLPRSALPRIIVGVTPVFLVAEDPLVFAAPLAAAVPASDLGAPIGSLAAYHLDIQEAIDRLTGSY